MIRLLSSVADIHTALDRASGSGKVTSVVADATGAVIPGVAVVSPLPLGNYKLEAHNLFNHPLLGAPDLEATSATFGQIRSSLQPTGTAAGAATYIPRSLQLGVRFEF